MAGHSLFNQQDSYSTFDHYLQEIREEINSKRNDYILNVNVEDWKRHIIDKYDFTPITVYTDKATVKLVGKGNIKVEDFGRQYDKETYSFEMQIPYTGWSHLFMLRPSNRVVNHPRVDTPNGDSGFITAVFTMREQNHQLFEIEKDKILHAFTSNVPNINADLAQFKDSVAYTFDSTYRQKKEKVLKENTFFERINISTESSTDKIFKVPSLEKKRIPEPVVDGKAAKKYIDNPSLPDDNYKDILEVIYTFYKAVEKKPSTYKTKGEEDLRDYVLPTLETRYNNVTVTGETFNKQGKTDILIKYTDGSNIFVAECKYWGGKVLFHETINQLFDLYLTWRDSKVAIILFVDNKEFSKVLATIKESVKDHPYYLRDNGINGESSFSYIFHFPTDKGKYVFVEIMAFHFPK